MRLISTLLLAVLIGCQSHAPRDTDHRPAGSSDHITVMTYNVLGGRNTDGARDLGRIAAVINELDPDVVALQEVDRGTRRLNGVDLAAELSKATGLRNVFGPAMPFDGGEYGVAILSRFPIGSTENHPLPHRDASEPRTLLLANLTVPDTDGSFVLLATHLDHQEDPSDRLAQARRVRAVATELEAVPMILAGDLNAVPGSEPLEILDAWSDSRISSEGGLTYPSDDPDRRIDYILVRPDSRWTIVRSFTGAEWRADDAEWQSLLKLASDHLPVIAELELRPE